MKECTCPVCRNPYVGGDDYVHPSERNRVKTKKQAKDLQVGDVIEMYVSVDYVWVVIERIVASSSGRTLYLLARDRKTRRTCRATTMIEVRS